MNTITRSPIIKKLSILMLILYQESSQFHCVRRQLSKFRGVSSRKPDHAEFTSEGIFTHFLYVLFYSKYFDDSNQLFQALMDNYDLKESEDLQTFIKTGRRSKLTYLGIITIHHSHNPDHKDIIYSFMKINVTC